MKKEKMLDIMGLVEVKEKSYTAEEVSPDLAYVFKDINDFKSYFITNGLPKENIGLVTSALVTILNDGTVVAYKTLCDYIISSTKELETIKKKNKIKMLTK